MSHDSPAPTNRLDGAMVARRLREEARDEAAELARSGGPPGLRVILAGENAASEAYVASKTRAAREAGLIAETIRLPLGVSPESVLREVERANRSAQVDGILVQLPLPPGHDARRVFDALDPEKDVDGFHPQNVGLLHQGRPVLIPCTPAGILALLDAYAIPLAGKRAVVVGRSDIVGKPCAALLASRDATVTLAHSKTRDLASVCREAEILIAAAGRPGLITADFVRPGAVVVDVGMNRIDAGEGLPAHLRDSPGIRQTLAEKGKVLVGDVDFDSVSPIAAWISPVPGGVGPLTVAMLLKNTVLAARRRRARVDRADLDPLTL